MGGNVFFLFLWGKWRIAMYSGMHRAFCYTQLNRVDTSSFVLPCVIELCLVLHLLYSIAFNIFLSVNLVRWHLIYPYHSLQYLAAGIHKVKNWWVRQDNFYKESILCHHAFHNVWHLVSKHLLSVMWKALYWLLWDI